MWASILSWVLKNCPAVAPVVAVIVAFFAGGYLAHLHYSEELATLEKQSYAIQAQLAKEKNEALAQVVNKQVELDSWRSTHADRISDLTKRVQLAEARSKRATESAGSTASTSEGRCRQLLVRGAEVVGRCSKLLGNVVSKHDTLIELNK